MLEKPPMEFLEESLGESSKDFLKEFSEGLLKKSHKKIPRGISGLISGVWWILGRLLEESIKELLRISWRMPRRNCWRKLCRNWRINSKKTPRIFRGIHGGIAGASPSEVLGRFPGGISGENAGGVSGGIARGILGGISGRISWRNGATLHWRRVLTHFDFSESVEWNGYSRKWCFIEKLS